MGLFISLSAFSADDDGTFTITIQGPEVEETVPASRPVRTTPRRQAVIPQQAPAATVAPRQSAQAPQRAVAVPAQTAVSSDQFRTYNVVTGDTIWSVAHRYAQLNRSINEFQVVASIYRNNPQAFGGGNVNNLLRTTLRIPSDALIAQENTQTGSALLAQGVMTLPPLPVSQPAVSPTVQSAPAPQLPQTAQSQVPSQQTVTPANTGKPANDIPVYTATETRIKEVQKQREAEENGELIPSGLSNKDSQNPNDRRTLAENGSQLQLDNSAATENGANVPAQGQGLGLTPEQLRQIQALLKKNPQESVDVKSIRIMLEENKKQIDQKTKVIEQQLSDAIARMKKSSAVTAQTAADSVSSLSSQYDNIIAGIQQDLIEIKGNVSKLSQDNDRMREMLLANDEKIEDMQLQMSQFTVSSVDASIDMDKPVMMILFGAGLLSLVILILFIIFKARARARARKYHDDFDFDDAGSLGSDDMLLSDDNGSIAIETPSPDSDEGDASSEEQSVDNNAAPAADSNVAPAADGETSPAAAPDTADSPADESTEDSQAQAEWDKAAEESAEASSNDQNVLDEWSKALNEDQSGAKETEVEGKSDDASVADEWAAALGEQEKSEKAQEESSDAPKKDEQEDMAAAWAAALGEQEGGAEEAKTADEPATPAEEKSGGDEQEDMAAAWAAALGEQDGGAGATSEEPKAKENTESSEPAESTQAEELKKSIEAAKAEPEKSAPAEEAVSEDVNIEDIAAEAPAEEAVPEDVNIDDIAAEAPAEEAVSEDVNIEDIAAEAPAEESVPEDINVEDIAAEATVEEAVSEDINVEDIAAEAPAEEAVSEDVNVEDIAAEAPAEEAVAEDVNVEDIVAEAPAEEAVSEDVNVEDIAAEAPAEEAVSEDVNVEEIAAEAPAEEAVSEDVNVEEIAAEPPAEEAVSEDVNVEDIAVEAPAENAAQDPEEQEIDVGDLVQNEGDDLASPADEISGEESALLDAMGNQENPTEDVQADVVETEVPAEGSGKVDEVVDDEIDLEVLLRPVETEGGDDLVQNEPVEESSETQSEEVATETLEESAPEQDENVTAAIGEAGEAEISEESASDAPVEENVAEESQDSVSGQDEVVSWEVPQDEYDVVSESSQNDSVKEAAADLAQLEARIGSAGHYMDPQAESDLMNMLGDGISPNENDLVQNEETAFSPEEISRMINGDTSQADVPDLQKVSNTIGPITANADLTDQATLAENISEGEKEILTPKEHQYYVDELNLARLYFETGDTEEAIKIIEDVQEHGSLDLKKEASKVMEAYGS